LRSERSAVSGRFEPSLQRRKIFSICAAHGPSHEWSDKRGKTGWRTSISQRHSRPSVWSRLPRVEWIELIAR